MKYNTKDVYFGCLTFNDCPNGVWKSEATIFLKNGDKYVKVKSKKGLEVNEYTPGTDEYLTVSELYPIVNMMKNKTNIPDEISDNLINLYLIKHKINKRVELKRINHYSEQSKTK